MRTRWSGLACVLILLLTTASLPAGAASFSQPAPAGGQRGDPVQEGPGIEVEPQLQAQLSADTTTGYLIYFGQRPDLSASDKLPWQERGRFVMKTLQDAAERSQAQVRAYLNGQQAKYHSFWIDNVIVVEQAGPATMNGLFSFPEIQAIRARRTMQVFEPVRKAPAQNGVTAVESNIGHVAAPQAWAANIDGQGSVVAGIDTGVRFTHQALVNHYRGKLAGGSFDHQYNWYDPFGDYPAAPGDGHGHGTHTMGTMVGDDGAANQIGMAPGASWIACRGCSDTGCTDVALLTCAQWVAAPTNLSGANPDPDRRPDVVNNSWGDCGQSYDGWFQGAVDSWHAAGIYPVFANGNASNCVGYTTPPACGTVGNPARYGNVTGVGSTGQSNGAYASHSNRGPSDVSDTTNPSGYSLLKPQVAAPGVAIRSAVNSGDASYASWSGTSMSAPHVAGLVALMWQAGACLKGDYAATEHMIEQTATPITTGLPGACSGEGPGQYPNQSTGWGEINAWASVQAAAQACTATGQLQGRVADDSSEAPIANATIRAELSATQAWSATTNAQGEYHLVLPEGTYTLDVTAYGYNPVQMTDIVVPADGAITRDVPLQALPMHTISATVRDAGTGWPLYARVDVSGYPGNPLWTDPATGAFAVDLPHGGVYTFTTNAWSPGYATAALQLGPLESNGIIDIALDADLDSCSAPGYRYADTLYAQDFEADDGAFMKAGTNSWAWGTVSSGPERAHSGSRAWATNLAGSYGNDEEGWLVSPAIDLSAAAGQPLILRWWQWLHTESDWDVAYVDVLKDGATDWTTVYEGDGPADLAWAEKRVVLDASYAASNFRMRFRFESDNSVVRAGWYVDDIAIEAGDCGAEAGGLVIGSVYDANTGAPLTGATVANDSGHATTALPTLDPAIDDSYYVLFSPAGSHTFSAGGAEGYGTVGHVVPVNSTANLRQDFALPAGQLAPSPSGLQATVVLGGNATMQLSVANQGSTTAELELVKRAFGFRPLVVEQPTKIPPSPSTISEPASIGKAPVSAAARREPAASVLRPFAGIPAFGIELIAVDLVSFDIGTPGTLATVGKPGGGRYYGGDFLGSDFSRLYSLDGSLWQELVSIDTSTGAALVIGSATTVAEQQWTGMAGDSTTQVLYAASTDCGRSSMLYRIDPATGMATPIGPITNAPCIAGIAMSAGGEMYGLDLVSDQLLMIDPDTGAGTVVGPVGFDANYAQGMDFDDATGALYLAAYEAGVGPQLRAADLATGNTVLIGSFPAGTQLDSLAIARSGTGVDWLTTNLITTTVPAGGNVPVEITFDTAAGGVMQPGDYYARLWIQNDTPYGTNSVPVTMTVGIAPECAFTSSSPDDRGTVTSFSSTSTGSAPLAFQWAFGDGGSATAANPSHTYAAAKVYDVVLTVSSPFGQDQCGGTVSIEAVPAPTFTSTIPGQAGASVSFTNTTPAVNPGVTGWLWDFGDPGSGSDNRSTIANPTHVYDQGGTYLVKLTATNARGAGAYSANVTVTADPPALYLPLVLGR